MNFIYVIHSLYWNHLIAFKKPYKKHTQKHKQQKGKRASRAPPFVVVVATVVSVATAVCDQVVTVQHVDDIDEVHQLDPVHPVDHKDEHHKDHIHKSRSSFMIHIKYMNHGFTHIIHDDFMMIHDLWKVILGCQNDFLEKVFGINRGPSGVVSV